MCKVNKGGSMRFVKSAKIQERFAKEEKKEAKKRIKYIIAKEIKER